MSSAEQSRKLQSRESEASVGCARPEQYCETVGLDMPKAFAISVLLLPDDSISRLMFSLILYESKSAIAIFYLAMPKKHLTFRHCLNIIFV